MYAEEICVSLVEIVETRPCAEPGHLPLEALAQYLLLLV